MDPLYIAASILLIFAVRFLLKPHGKAPPGPRGLPVVGYLPFLGVNLHHDLEKLAAKYGPIFKLNLGHLRYTVISSPALAREVLRDHDAVFAHRLTPAAVGADTFAGNHMAWSPPTPAWRAMRRVFAGRVLNGSYDLRRAAVRAAVARLAAAGSEPVDVGRMASATERSVSVNITWGATATGEFGERVAAEVSAVMAGMMEVIGKLNVSDYYPILARFDLQGIRREMENVMESYDKIVEDVIAEHDNRLSGDETETEAETASEKRDFLQIMMELVRKGDAEVAKINQKQLRAMFLDAIGGGSDTSVAIEWAMAELMNNPESMAKAQKEVNDVVGFDNIVEESHIPNLKYLECVLKETLRLHPSIALIPRSPDQTSTIGGFSIPKGSGVFINIWSIQRDPSIWENPKEFKPERFLDASTINQYHYLPFGSGRRTCPGRALGERLILHFLASLLHSFDWSLPNGVKLDMSETFGLVVRKSTPLIAIPTPRSPDSAFYM